MSVDAGTSVGLKIGHILFLDIVGYSKLATNEQRRQLELLNGIVRGTDHFRAAEAANKLFRLPTGDGMALAFFTSPDAPVRCAAAVSRALKGYPELKVRMGIHSGPVEVVHDVNDRPNVAGAGINMAQRVMDCADAGHILLSKRAADDLAQYDEWKPQLHDLGEMEVKHGVRVPVVNFYNHEIGNPGAPSKLVQAEEAGRAATKAAARRKRRRTLIATSAIALATLLAAVSTWAWHRRVALASAYQAGIGQIVEKSIAVLPFENFDPDKQSAYFADGVQDDILTDLAKVADLKVISRRSVVQYRGTNQSVRDIGQALQVAYVLEGTVRRIGNQLRITAQLTDTRTEVQKWAQKYDRNLSDLFAIQNEISEAIVTQLKAAISPAEKAAITTAPTNDIQAYDLYLQARAMVHDLGVGPKVRDENRPLAKKLLEEAIARDPKFVLAYCLLSEVQTTARYWAEKPTPEQLATAKATAETAVRLAPDSAQAHLALAGVYYALEDQKRGIEEIEVAARAMPNSAEVAGALGDVAINRGQWKEALQHLQKAVQLDPRDPETALALIGYYIDLRWYDEAEQLTERTMAALPPATAREFWARKFYINVGRADLKAAMSALEQSPDHITSASTSYNHHIADILIMERRYADGEKRILEIPERAIKGNTVPGSGINPYARGFYALRLGIAYRAEGKQQEAREAFENSRQGFLGWLNEHPEEAMALALLAVTDAGCGRKEDSMREAQKALDTWPMSREPLPAINLRAEVALAYAWNGERDRAIELLQSIVKLPGGPTGGRLQLDPAWDDLQNDPRFKQLILEARKPVDLEHLHDSSTKN